MSLFGRNRGAVLLGKVESLQSLRKSSEALAQFYVFLGVLDSKATGLLTADAVIVAILVGFLALPDAIKSFLNQPTQPRLDHVRSVLELQVLLIGISALLCLLVVSIGWSMLAKIPLSPTSEDDCAEELQWLANVVSDRTRYYWVAWALTLCVFLLMLAWWSWCYFVGAAAVAIVWWRVRG
jgi:hypothetical protein